MFSCGSCTRRSVAGLSVAILSYNLYEIIAYENARTVMRGLMCASGLLVGAITVLCLNKEAIARNAERCMVSLILIAIILKHAYDVALGDSWSQITEAFVVQ